MISQDKIRLMAQMTYYDEHVGKKNRNMASYFRGDYIGLQVLKSIISATIVFLIVVALFIYYDFEVFMKDIYQIDLMATGKNLLTIYLVFVAVYSAITYIVFAIKYRKSQRNLREYYRGLRRLGDY